jgi:hypothetical protein
MDTFEGIWWCDKHQMHECLCGGNVMKEEDKPGFVRPRSGQRYCDLCVNCGHHDLEHHIDAEEHLLVCWICHESCIAVKGD